MKALINFILPISGILLSSCYTTYPEGKPYRNSEYDFISYHFGPTFTVFTIDTKRFRSTNIERVIAHYGRDRMEFIRIYDSFLGSTTMMRRPEFDYLAHDINQAYNDLISPENQNGHEFFIINQNGLLITLRRYPNYSDFQILEEGRRFVYPTEKLVNLFISMAITQ